MSSLRLRKGISAPPSQVRVLRGLVDARLLGSSLPDRTTRPAVLTEYPLTPFASAIANLVAAKF